MQHLKRIPRTFRKQAVRADQRTAVVLSEGLFWSVVGEFTTPAPGLTPAFIASDIALVFEDGNVSSSLIDSLAAEFIAHLELLASYSLDSREAA
ncbi:hypothetical protein HpMS107_60500 [Helicobacter pylori]